MEGNNAGKEVISSASYNVSDGPSSEATFGLNSVIPIETKISSVKTFLETDKKAADARWSLFVAACQSYRFDTCVRPFPPQFVKDGCKDIDSLRDVLDHTLPFTLLLNQLQHPELHQINMQVVDLLYWMFVQLRDTRLKTVPKEQFGEILKYANSEMKVQPPSHIFEVNLVSRNNNDSKWEDLCRDYGTMYSYHGSRLENFHSILHYGLQQHMNKNSLFGSGVYLSSELTVSLPYSPMGYAWGGSLIGSELSTIALCEVINHPGVKCRDKGKDPSRLKAADSIGGEVPNKYYIVENSDLVRIKYLLVYSKSSNDSLNSSNFLISWIKRHKLLTVILGYVFLLAAVGLSNNQTFQRYWRNLMKKTDAFK